MDYYRVLKMLSSAFIHKKSIICSGNFLEKTKKYEKNCVINIFL